MDTNVKINCETSGFEEATAEVEQLAEALGTTVEELYPEATK